MRKFCFVFTLNLISVTIQKIIGLRTEQQKDRRTDGQTDGRTSWTTEKELNFEILKFENQFN